MAADLYTKPFTKELKWIQLCAQNNLLAKPLIDNQWPDFPEYADMHFRVYQVALQDQKGGKVTEGDQELLPAEYSGVNVAFGWTSHMNKLLYYVREPVYFRVPTDNKFEFRTTWIRNLTGWKIIESKRNISHLARRTGPIGEWCDRGLFIFEARENIAAPCSLVPCKKWAWIRSLVNVTQKAPVVWDDVPK